jgi:hypothetical protein
MSDPEERRSVASRVLRGYLIVCLVGALLGAGTAVFFFATGDAVLGWTFVVLTALLLPAYRGAVVAARRSHR